MEKIDKSRLLSVIINLFVIIVLIYYIYGIKDAQTICSDHSISISNRTDTMFTIEKRDGHTYCCGSEAEGYNPDKKVFFGLIKGANEYSLNRCELVK